MVSRSYKAILFTVHRAAALVRSGENNRELLLSSWLHSQVNGTSQMQGRRRILQPHPSSEHLSSQLNCSELKDIDQLTSLLESYQMCYLGEGWVPVKLDFASLALYRVNSQYMVCIV